MAKKRIKANITCTNFLNCTQDLSRTAVGVAPRIKTYLEKHNMSTLSQELSLNQNSVSRIFLFCFFEISPDFYK